MASSSALSSVGSSVEHLVVELDGALDVADLPAADDGGGVQVLGLLLRVVDEFGEPEHDLDQLVPVLLLAVELHQLGEQPPVVGALVERGDVVLGGASCGRSACCEAMSPISSRAVALVAARDVEVARLEP